jgi:putative tryptophan/tyrosine transport system substrate-binding protein
MAIYIRRREFILTLSGAAAAWPLAARAQQAAMPVIGFLSAEWPDLFADRLRVFHGGLSETGYVEGRNVGVEYRWAEGRNDRLPALAADLVRRQVTVIVTAGSTPATLAARAATTTIPIVFYLGADPVEVGLVTSLSRPGGNLTGVVTLNVEVGAKRLELLHELAPTATIVALLLNPTSPTLTETLSRDPQAAARKLGLQLHVLHASSEHEFDTAFATLVQLRAGGLVIGADALFNSRSEQLAALTVRHAVPAIYQYREFVSAGGLMSYGTTVVDTYRPLGVYTGRILKGEKPAELPVQQATRLELIINMKTARALGLTVPLPLIGRADEVIE